MARRESRMELFRVLLAECLSAAAQEIFSLVERTLLEAEEDMAGDRHHTLPDVAQSCSEDSLQTSARDVKSQCAQSAAGRTVRVCWEPENKADEAPCQREDNLAVHTHTTNQCTRYKVDAKAYLTSATPACKLKEEPDESGVTAFPLSMASYDNSELDQESLQPLCLYQIQSQVTAIDQDSTAALPEVHIKTEPDGVYVGSTDSNTDDQLLPPVSPGTQSSGEPESAQLKIKGILKRNKRLGKSPVQFEAGTAHKPYKCPCCSKCFSLTKTLIRHMKVHADYKQYQCQYCGRSFCQNSALVTHTRMHTGERPYRCRECHKTFAQKGSLTTHMSKHTA